MTVEVAPRVHRLGTSLINWYLVEAEDGLTLVDAGIPSHRPMLDAALTELGRTLSDVRAVILTHAHTDHTGFAESLREEAGIPVLVHEGDAELARTGKQPKRERSMLPYLRHPMAYRMLWALARGGAMRPPHIGHVTTFRDGDVLDVPGRPRVIHTPGHTDGHCVFHLPDRGALMMGDLLCTLNPLTGGKGPQLLPSAFGISAQQSLDSLAALEGIDAVLLFGHGEPWREDVSAALDRAREQGPT
jgi:glyoxylase-like metal-dependent hydrolase (beta-lactamase superfamily II)